MMHLRAATIEDLATLLRWDAKAHVIAGTGADDAYPWTHELPRDVLRLGAMPAAVRAQVA
jgi:hypothetical protein